MPTYRTVKPLKMSTNWFREIDADEKIGKEYVENGDVITAEGDLIVGNGLGNEERLPIGTTDQVLMVEGGTAVWKTQSTQKCIFFYYDTMNVVDSYYRVIQVSSNGSVDMFFNTPSDFTSLVSVDAVFISLFANPTADIDLYSNYAACGENKNTHQESNTTSTFDTGTVNNIETIDLSSVFSSLSAGDLCAVHIDHNSIGGALNYFGVRLVYT